jgi:hypothetical protein
MVRNVGNLDRIIRIILGVVIFVLGIAAQSWLALLAVIPLGTALVGWCPLYRLFGMNTCPVNQRA